MPEDVYRDVVLACWVISEVSSPDRTSCEQQCANTNTTAALESAPPTLATETTRSRSPCEARYDGRATFADVYETLPRICSARTEAEIIRAQAALFGSRTPSRSISDVSSCEDVSPEHRESITSPATARSLSIAPYGQVNDADADGSNTCGSEGTRTGSNGSGVHPLYVTNVNAQATVSPTMMYVGVHFLSMS